jgi:hypothetical protein
MPVIADGKGLTVTIAVLKQPVEVSVWVMVVVPASTPVTVPVVLVPVTVAMLPLLLIQGPVPEEVRVVPAPLHMVSVPVIFAGTANTVSTDCTKQPPGAV